MARITRTQPSADYQAIRDAARKAGEKGDCSVIAVSIACGVSYEAALAALTAAGRKPREGAYLYQIEKAINALGFRKINWRTDEMQARIDSYPGAHCNLKSITTHHPVRFARQWADVADQSLILITPRHVAAMKGGRVHDWTEGRAVRVTSIWSIVPK